MTAGLRIAVCVKQVLETGVPLAVVDKVVRQETPWPIAQVGSAERAALEAALAWRTQRGGEVLAVSVGQTEAEAALRLCLARGADRALHIVRADDLDAVGSATAVADVLASRAVDLILCGGASGDGASGLFPAVLATALDYALVTAVAGLRIDARRLELERRLERGNRELVGCALPAVLAVEPTLAEPRYISVRAVQAAGGRTVETVRSDVRPGTGATVLAVEPAKPRPKRVSGPDARLSAMDRLAHLVTGGVQPKQSGGFTEGTADKVADDIIRYLQDKGFVPGRTP